MAFTSCSKWLTVLGALGFALPQFGCSGSSSPSGSPIPSIEPVRAWERALSLPKDRGMRFERDAGFLIQGHTVPTILVLDTGYVLFSSAPERGQIALHISEDGVSWKAHSRLDLSSQPAECGPMALDVSVQYVDEGYRLLVETWSTRTGLTDPSGKAGPPPKESPTTFCAWRSRDGLQWRAESKAIAWEDKKATWPSGLEFLQLESEQRVFYTDTYPDLDGIRVAQITEPSRVRAGARKTALARSLVDPNPVRLLEGGVRLYHTRALEGALGFSDSTDGYVFPPSRDVEGLSRQKCYTPPERPSPPDACFLDPFVLRLPDDRVLIYFSVFESLAGKKERRGIGRAWAVD